MSSSTGQGKGGRRRGGERKVCPSSTYQGKGRGGGGGGGGEGLCSGDCVSSSTGQGVRGGEGGWRVSRSAGGGRVGGGGGGGGVACV